jgi:cysteine sulfinate desulfinase/cysteine desulfurase-like protein
VRFSLGASTTEAEVMRALEAVAQVVASASVARHA